MSALDNANAFFEACETAQGWAACQQYVAEGASFSAQSEPIAEIESVEGYTEWMSALGNQITPGSSYDLHASSYDEASKTAIYFATFKGTHTGDAGPVPATGKSTASHYVYIISMDNDDKVKSMVKVWNAPWAMKELGWM